MASVVEFENPDLDDGQGKGQKEAPDVTILKGVGGRPPVNINWGEFDKLCALQCTKEEIAGWFNCSPDTIERAVWKKWKLKFKDYRREKAAKGKVSLRRAQFKKAIAGDSLMLIWLGKQYLGQGDKPDPGLYDDEPDQDLDAPASDSYGVVFVGQIGDEDTRQPPVAVPEPVRPSNASPEQ